MRRKWPLLFVIVPLLELYLIIKVGSHIGALWTVVLVIATAVVGINLLRFQGMATLRNAQQNMARGNLPAMEMMEGIALAVGGALLITPGFLTDTIGFLCLIPFSRRAIIRYMMKNASIQMHGGGSGGFGGQTYEQQPGSGSSQNNDQSRIIEGEYRRKD